MTGPTLERLRTLAADRRYSDEYIGMLFRIAAAQQPTDGPAWRAALRPDHSNPDHLDDVVVCNVPMFRLEMMDDQTAWMCCYLDDSPEAERIDFSISVTGRRLVVTCTDRPESITYEDNKETR